MGLLLLYAKAAVYTFPWFFVSNLGFQLQQNWYCLFGNHDTRYLLSDTQGSSFRAGSIGVCKVVAAAWISASHSIVWPVSIAVNCIDNKEKINGLYQKNREKINQFLDRGL